MFKLVFIALRFFSLLGHKSGCVDICLGLQISSRVSDFLLLLCLYCDLRSNGNGKDSMVRSLRTCVL